MMMLGPGTGRTAGPGRQNLNDLAFARGRGQTTGRLKRYKIGRPVRIYQGFPKRHSRSWRRGMFALRSRLADGNLSMKVQQSDRGGQEIMAIAPRLVKGYGSEDDLWVFQGIPYANYAVNCSLGWKTQEPQSYATLIKSKTWQQADCENRPRVGVKSI